MPCEVSKDPLLPARRCLERPEPDSINSFLCGLRKELSELYPRLIGFFSGGLESAHWLPISADV